MLERRRVNLGLVVRSLCHTVFADSGSEFCRSSRISEDEVSEAIDFLLDLNLTAFRSAAGTSSQPNRYTRSSRHAPYAARLHKRPRRPHKAPLCRWRSEP